MEKLKSWITLRNFNMPQKFIIAFLFLFVVPTLIISFISYRNYSASIEKTTTAYVSQASNEIKNRINSYMLDVEAATNVPYYLKDMQRDLQIPGNNPDKVLSMEGYIRLMNRDKSSENFIYIFDSFGKAFYINQNGVRSNVDDLYDEFKRIAYNANGRSVVLGSQKVTDSTRQIRYYLTVVRSIKDLSNYEQIGVIAIDADINIIDHTVQELDSITKGNTVIIDRDNTVIYDSSRVLTTKKFPDTDIIDKARNVEGSFRVNRQGSSYICIYSLFPELGWKMFITIPEEFLYLDAKKTSSFIVLISVIASGVAFLFFIILSYTITKPLRKLKMLMYKVKGGDLDVQFNVKSNDELGLVGNSFNHMIMRLKELIEEVYLTRLRKKQTELDALQGQISPHFIYNTLETIRMISVMHKVDEISELTLIFGKLLRYSVNHVNEMVTVKEELQHLKNYVFLQNKRFSNKFTLDIRVQNSVMEMRTIKLILQPIVENSILHGLERKKGAGTITIVSEQTEEFTIFIIRDNGVGIDTDTLLELNNKMEKYEENQQSGTGIGLRNVNERIKLYYGDKYGLSVESKLGVGTVVTLRLPIR